MDCPLPALLFRELQEGQELTGGNSHLPPTNQFTPDDNPTLPKAWIRVRQIRIIDPDHRLWASYTQPPRSRRSLIQMQRTQLSQRKSEHTNSDRKANATVGENDIKIRPHAGTKGVMHSRTHEGRASCALVAWHHQTLTPGHLISHSGTRMFILSSSGTKHGIHN